MLLSMLSCFYLFLSNVGENIEREELSEIASHLREDVNHAMKNREVKPKQVRAFLFSKLFIIF